MNQRALQRFRFAERRHKRDMFTVIGGTAINIASTVIGGKLQKLQGAQELAKLTLQEQQSTYNNLIYEGLWYSPLIDSIEAFINEAQKNVSGTVKIKLHKGNATVIGRKSEKSLYQVSLATYSPEDDFDHKAAAGFIKLWGLPLEVYSIVHAKDKKLLKECA